MSHESNDSNKQIVTIEFDSCKSAERKVIHVSKITIRFLGFKKKNTLSKRIMYENSRIVKESCVKHVKESH